MSSSDSSILAVLCRVEMFTADAAPSVKGKILFEADLSNAHMEACHRDLILRHYHRLTRIIHEHDEASIGNYTNKQAAQEQLARMTLVIRDYAALKQHEDINIESMAADIVDASFSVQGPEASFSQSMFVNPQLLGREHEIAGLMQEMSAESADDVIELWNLIPEKSNKVVPDIGSRDQDLAKDVDWNHVLCRSRSEDHLLHLNQEFAIEDAQKWRSDLEHRELEQLDLIWPPVFRDPEPNVGRQRLRSRANTVTSSSAGRAIDQ